MCFWNANLHEIKLACFALRISIATKIAHIISLPCPGHSCTAIPKLLLTVVCDQASKQSCGYEWNHLQVETCKNHVETYDILSYHFFASWQVESYAYNSKQILSCTCNLYVDPFFGPCGATPDSDRQALNLFGAIKFCDGARSCDETVRCDEIGLWRMFGRWKFCFTSNEEVAGNDLPVACLSANKLFSRILGICLSIMTLAEFWTIGVLGAKQCLLCCHPLVFLGNLLASQLPTSWCLAMISWAHWCGLWTCELCSSPRTFSLPLFGICCCRAFFPALCSSITMLLTHLIIFPIFSRSYLHTFDQRCFVHAMLSLHLSDGTLWIYDVMTCSHHDRFR